MTKPQARHGAADSFVAAYSRNIYTGGFPFYGAAVSFEEAAPLAGPRDRLPPCVGVERL